MMGNSEGSHSKTSTPHGKSKSVGASDTPQKGSKNRSNKSSSPGAGKNSATSPFGDSKADQFYTCKPGVTAGINDVVKDHTHDIPSYYYTGGRVKSSEHTRPTSMKLQATVSNHGNGAKVDNSLQINTANPNTQNTDADDIDSAYLTASTGFKSQQLSLRPMMMMSTLTREDLRRRIDTFNENSHGLRMNLGAGGTLQGFIRVHILLTREITMCVTAEPPSLSDVISRGTDTTTGGAEGVTVETKIALPPDTTKLVHVNDKTRTCDVIQLLLTKFNITDDPTRFILCEKDTSTMLMRKLSDDDIPLLLSLSWVDDGVEQFDRKQFVLRDTNIDTVQWEAFSVPELNNFLVFLEREEQEQVLLTQHRYRQLRDRLTLRLASLAASKPAAAVAPVSHVTPVVPVVPCCVVDEPFPAISPTAYQRQQAEMYLY